MSMFVMSCAAQARLKLTSEASVGRRANVKSPRTTPAVHTRDQLCAGGRCAEQIEITGGLSEYKITVPISQVDPRAIYIFAEPGTLLIEIRFNNTIRHRVAGGLVTETVEERLSRKLALPDEIEKSTIRVQMFPDSIQITALKALTGQQRPWSKLVDFDTRGHFDGAR